MEKASLLIKLLLGLFALVFSACTPTIVHDSIADVSSSTAIPVAETSIISQVAASSFPELTYFADLVIIGQVVAKGEVINTARDANNPSKPDQRFYSINQIYRVEVDEVIKGDELKSLLVVQNQGQLSLSAGETPTVSDVENEIRRNEQKNYIPLSADKQYLFFLRILDKANYDLDGYRSSDLYAGALEPWRFEITSTGIVIPETLLPGIERYFPASDLTTVLEATTQSFVQDRKTNPYPEPFSTEGPGLVPYP